MIKTLREDEIEAVRLARSTSAQDREAYRGITSRLCPVNDIFIEWVYLIDFDLNVFRVSDSDIDTPEDPISRGIQFFRLDNVPLHFLGCAAIEETGLDYPIMSDRVPPEHFANHLGEIPAPNPALLVMYQTLSPPPTATFSLPTGPRVSAWHKLQLLLISEFVEYFTYSFIDSCPSRVSSPFVFRQLAYAILCLTSQSGLKFHRTTAPYLLAAGAIEPECRTPSWEPPDTDRYWLGDVLIVLNQDLATSTSGVPSPSTQASIARAVQLAPATPTTAVIVSVHAVVLMHIAADQHITHTPALPLFTLDRAAAPFTPHALATLASVSYATPGVLALLDLFAAHPRIHVYAAAAAPPVLPTELWRAVFQYADEATQDALEGACRFFRALAVEYPRVGGCTLMHWRGERFVCEGGGAVDVKGAAEGVGEGWEVGVWGEGKVRLGMKLLEVVE